VEKKKREVIPKEILKNVSVSAYQFVVRSQEFGATLQNKKALRIFLKSPNTSLQTPNYFLISELPAFAETLRAGR
jgi:hypothetical protein